MTRRGRLIGALGIAALAAVALPFVSRTAPRPHPQVQHGPGVAVPTDEIARARAKLPIAAAQPGATNALRERWQTTTDRAEKVRMLDEARLVPDSSGLGFLVEVAGSADPLAAQAAAAIGKISTPRLAASLASLAASDGPAIIRANAARALGHAGAGEQADQLAALVADAESPLRVRQEAALALAHVDDPAAAAALGSSLDVLAPASGQEMMQLRISIVQALGTIPESAAKEALMRHRARDLASLERAFVDRALASGQLPG